MLKFNKVSTSQLMSEQVKQASENGSLCIIKRVNNEEEKLYMRLIKEMTRKCEDCYAPGHCEWSVEYYVGRLLHEDIEPFRLNMKRETNRVRFICHLIGRLLGVGVFQTRPIDLAKKLDLQRPDVGTVRKYIREGEKIETDKIVIPRIPSDLCSSETKESSHQV